MRKKRAGTARTSAKGLRAAIPRLFLGLAIAGCQARGPEAQTVASTSAGKLQDSPSTGKRGPQLFAKPANPKRQSVENLRRIAAAMHEYAKNHFDLLPPAAYMEENLRIKEFQMLMWPASELARQGDKYTLKGRTVPLFSWRVAILPYLGEGDLAKQFKMDEPWDSEHNKKLLARMPALFAAPVMGKDSVGLTYYQVFVGEDTPFNGMEPPRRPSKFMDGMLFTFLVVEAGEPVPWTKPQDVSYDPRKHLPKLGGLFDDGFHVVMAMETSDSFRATRRKSKSEQPLRRPVAKCRSFRASK